MDDFVLNVRQISQYPQVGVQPTDFVLAQQGFGGPYISSTSYGLVAGAISGGGTLASGGLISAPNFLLPVNGSLSWNDVAALAFGPKGWSFTYATPEFGNPLMLLNVDGSMQLLFNTLRVARDPFEPFEVATANYVTNNTVASFNGRLGAVCLSSDDVSDVVGGVPATQDWVNAAICEAVPQFIYNNAFVYTFNGRVGNITLTLADINCANFSCPGFYPQAPSPALGDASNNIATTMFVDESLNDLYDQIRGDISAGIDLSGYALLNSPAFTGVPTAPTANPGNTTGQIATTAFVMNAVAASTAGVSSFNTRTGAVVLTAGDITGAGGALLASPNFSGVPTAPTAAPATSNTQIATTAFVAAAVAAATAGVASFNGRTGVVTLTTADVTGAGGAPIANPAFTGTVTAPTPAPATNNTTVATTAYVTAAITAMGAGVASFNGRTGAVTLQGNDVSAVGGAMVASPTFTGTPSAPTAVAGTNTTQLATTAFVIAQIAATTAGVTSFNSRTGAVTLTTADVTGAGGAPISSPALTGVPTAPTAAQTSSDTTLATTAFVHAAITAQAANTVTSFNSRSGAVTLAAGDISAAGGALIASPTFTGIPAGPTATAGTNTTQLATTAFVLANAGVLSFNTRTGAVTLNSTDITSAGGAILNSPAFTGTPTAPTATVGTNNTQIATTAFVMAAAAAAGVTSFNTRTGAVTLTATDVTNVNGALLSQGTSPPASPGSQNLWYDTTGGQLYIYTGTVWAAVSTAH